MTFISVLVRFKTIQVISGYTDSAGVFRLWFKAIGSEEIIPRATRLF